VLDVVGELKGNVKEEIGDAEAGQDRICVGETTPQAVGNRILPAE
jgi:hypothetical protein